MNNINSLSESNISKEYTVEADRASLEISKVLKEFIVDRKDLPKVGEIGKRKIKKNSSILSYHEQLLFIVYFSFVFIFLSLILLVLYTLGILTSKIILLTPIVFLIIILVFLAYTVVRANKKTRKQAISKVSYYNREPYYQTIEHLGSNFYEEHLHRVEIDLKISICENNKISGKEKKYLQLSTISLAVLAIFIFDIHIDNFIAFLSAVIVIAAILAVVIEIFYEHVYRERMDVYEKCVLILQEAQKVAANEELDAIRAYDVAIASDDEAIPFEQAIAEIEKNR